MINVLKSQTGEIEVLVLQSPRHRFEAVVEEHDPEAEGEADKQAGRAGEVDGGEEGVPGRPPRVRDGVHDRHRHKRVRNTSLEIAKETKFQFSLALLMRDFAQLLGLT